MRLISIHELTLISKSGQAQLPCSPDRNSLLNMELANSFLFAPGIYFGIAVALLAGLFVACPLLLLSFPIQFFLKGNKTSSVENGEKKCNNS